MLNVDSHNVRQSIRPGGPLYLRLLHRFGPADPRAGSIAAPVPGFPTKRRSGPEFPQSRSLATSRTWAGRRREWRRTGRLHRNQSHGKDRRAGRRICALPWLAPDRSLGVDKRPRRHRRARSLVTPDEDVLPHPGLLDKLSLQYRLTACDEIPAFGKRGRQRGVIRLLPSGWHRSALLNRMLGLPTSLPVKAPT